MSKYDMYRPDNFYESSNGFVKNRNVTKLYSTTNESVCNYMQGQTKDLEIKEEDVDIRLDFEVEKKTTSKLWGQVKDTDGRCVEGAFVMLLKPKYIRGNIEYVPIATAVSDCMGFYQFEIDQIEKGCKYKVSVGK